MKSCQPIDGSSKQEFRGEVYIRNIIPVGRIMASSWDRPSGLG
jgi:hypothetical protein